MKKLAFSVFAAALTFGANAADDVKTTAAATDSCCGYDGFYMGLGVAAIDDGFRTEENFPGKFKKESDHKTKLAGTVAMGFEKRIKEKAFLGLEAGLDASQNSEFDDGDARVNGLTPSVALKLGFVHPETRTMGYLKAGAAYSRAKWNTHAEDAAGNKTPYEVRNFKWSPIVALGGEKLCGKLRTRLEAEYRFRTNKTLENINGKGGIGNFKFTNRGAITLRAMAIYTIKK